MSRKLLSLFTLLALASGIVLSCTEVMERNCSYTGACSDDPTTGGTSNSGGTAPGGAGTGAGDAPSTCTPACDDPTPLCDENTNQCVECLDHSDCTDNATARCDAGVCKPCDDSSQCTNSDSTACDAKTGECVECLNEEHCDEHVCHPATKTCTNIPARELHACEACEYDAQCQVGQVCVETKYSYPEEGVVGTFCLWKHDAPPPGPNGTCGLSSRPFAKTSPVTSVDGEETIVCELRTTTCPALLQHGTEVPDCTTPFTDDAACGAPGFNDGRCRYKDEFNQTPMCSYPCGGNEDCRPGFTCPAAGDQYCSL